jgi:hypothetical protein
MVVIQAIQDQNRAWGAVAIVGIWVKDGRGGHQQKRVWNVAQSRERQPRSAALLR